MHPKGACVWLASPPRGQRLLSPTRPQTFQHHLRLQQAIHKKRQVEMEVQRGQVSGPAQPILPRPRLVHADGQAVALVRGPEQGAALPP